MCPLVELWQYCVNYGCYSWQALWHIRGWTVPCTWDYPMILQSSKSVSFEGNVIWTDMKEESKVVNPENYKT